MLKEILVSGFGLRGFKALKEESKKNITKKFIKNIIVGEDLAAVVTLLDLHKTFSPNDLRIICSIDLSRESIEKRIKHFVSSVRRDEAATVLSNAFPALELEKNDTGAVFYKESQFKSFSGKSKPAAPLIGKEEEFVSDYYTFKFEKLLVALGVSLNDWENLDTILNEYRLNANIKEIEQKEPQDLVDKTYWSVVTTTEDIFECENLIWADNLKTFISNLKNSDELSNETLQFFQEIKNYPGYLVHFESNGKVYDSTNTMFLPQSLTHDWGYFIGQFDEAANDKQSFSFLGQVHDDEINTEELAKKIKLLKRTLKRTLEDFSKLDYEEDIYFSENMLVDGVKDELYEEFASRELPHLFFLGQSAPLKREKFGLVDQEISHIGELTRSLLSISQLRSNPELNQ
jgi:hypothetical protein